MDTGLIAKRYARALAEYARNRGEDGLACRQCRDLFGFLRASKELRDAVESAIVSPAEKARLVESLFRETPCRSLMDFIRLVIKHDRESCLCLMLYSFINLYEEEHHIREAVLTTAVPLDRETEDALLSVFRRKTRSEIVLHKKTDPSLIGGFVFRIGDIMVDASLSSQLKLLRNGLGNNPERKI